MLSAARLLWQWLAEAYDNFWILVLFNIFWALLTVLIVPAIPAAAGLYYATNQVAHQQPVTWRTFFVGMRAHFWLSWRWGLLNVAVLIVLAVNLKFYGELAAGQVYWPQGIFLGLAALWGLVQLFAYPLLLEQSDRRLRLALRNSLVLVVRRPGLTLALSLFLAGLIALSTLVLLPFWLFLTASLCAFLCNRGAIYLIDISAGRPSEES